MNLLNLITNKIDALQTEEAAAKFFSVTVTRIKKWYGGTEQPTCDAAQRVLDEEIAAGRLLPAAFAPESSAKRTMNPVPAPEPAPKPTLSGADLADLASGAQRPAIAVTEASALVAMSPEDLEMQLAACLGMMPQENRITMLDMLAKGLERRAVICVPNGRYMTMASVQSIVGLSRGLRVAGMETTPERTLIHRARNLIAEQFLRSDAEWSIWIDDDMIVPFGNPNFFRAKTGKRNFPESFAKMNALSRLTSHEDQTIVGAVYTVRNDSGTVCGQLGLAPKNDQDKQITAEIKKGPSNKIVPVEWVAMGLTAIHRSVFEDIKAKLPHLAPSEAAQRAGAPFNFFSMYHGEIDGQDIGEDVLFCKRAREAGHQPHLDLAVHAGHIGNYCFMP